MLLTYFLAMMPSMTAPLVYFSCLAGLLTWLMAAAKGEPASVARAPIAVVFMVKAGCGGQAEGDSCQGFLGRVAVIKGGLRSSLCSTTTTTTPTRNEDLCMQARSTFYSSRGQGKGMALVTVVKLSARHTGMQSL